MKGLVGGFVLAAALTTASWADTPKDTLVIGKNIDDIITMDPAEMYELSTSEILVNIYDRLMGLEPGDMKTLVPTAAESYKVGDDGKTFTFVLKPNLVFHSGNPVTAEDVAFSFSRVIKLGLTPAYIFDPLGWTPDNVDSMLKPLDARTIEIHVGDQLAPSYVLNLFSTVTSSIVDKKEALAHEKDGDLGHEWLKTNTAGSGSFKLKVWKPNETVILERDEKAWRGVPAMKRVIVRHIPEPASQRLQLEKGDIDIALNLTADQIAGLAGNKDVAIDPAPKATINYLGLNQKVKELANPKVWEALRWAVDYQGMADTFLKGRYIVNQSFWPAGFFASLEENPYHLDLAKAKQLLVEAGYPDGFTIEFDAPSSAPFNDVAQSIQQTFGQIGVKVNITPAEAKQVLTKYRARTHGMVVMYWGPDFFDPHSNAGSFAYNPDNSDDATSKPLAWRNAWGIPEITQQTLAALKEPDTEKRRQMYLDLQRELQAHSPFIFLFQEVEQVARRANVQGYFSGPGADLVFYRGVTK